MTSLLLDTHAWAWSLSRAEALSKKVLTLLNEADRVLISPISIFEIGQKVRIGKWPEMQPYISELPSLFREQGGLFAIIEPELCLLAATLQWDHRDPFDRIIAATAMYYGVPLASADASFDELARAGHKINRVW